MSLNPSKCKRYVGRSGFLMVVAFALAGCAANSYALRQQGKAAMADQHYAVAAKKFHASLKADPTDARTLFLLGQADLKLNHPLDAQLALEKAVALARPNSAQMPQMLDDLAEAMSRQHENQQLRNFLQHQVNERGTVADYLRQAKYLAKMGDMDKARLAYRQAAYFAPPKDDRPYLAMARFYQSIHDIESAKKALRYAYYVNPNDPRIANQLRQYNIVPGPTVALKPPKASPLLQR